MVITPLFFTASKSSRLLKMMSSVISNGPAFLLRTTLAMSRNGVGTVCHQAISSYCIGNSAVGLSTCIR